MALQELADSSSTSTSLAVLQGFVLDRVLSQDPRTRTASLLGTFPQDTEEGSGPPSREQAVVLLEKTHIAKGFFGTLGVRSEDAPTQPRTMKPRVAESDNGDTSQVFPLLSKVQLLGQNSIYTWLLGWHASPSETYDAAPADIKISIIRPCTEAVSQRYGLTRITHADLSPTSQHILKYENQEKYMVYETPKMYKEVIEPWIESQDISRIQWVYNILDKKKESENILFEDPDPKTGFIILPDLKWDRRTLSSLYLVAIVRDRTLRSLRDLRPAHTAEGAEHVELLEKVCRAAEDIAGRAFNLHAKEGAGADVGGALRCFIHYQPTYYHLHIHILAATFTSHPGAIVGQAHLVQDVVDMLRLGVDFRDRTLGYALGERNEIWEVLKGDGV